MNDKKYTALLSKTRVMKDVPMPFTKRLTLKDLDYKKKKSHNINVDLLVKHLKSGGKVRVDAAIEIARKAAELFREESNVVTLKAPITMFGDIHGQFHDLVNQTGKLAKPCAEDPWLFLGDYVDRGLFGVEVVLYLFAIKIQNPKGVYLIRGNHECRHLTAAYNF
jgi:serine/threonine-protein phosphatase 2B catalytic subunit